jgi:hypothetical protein
LDALKKSPHKALESTKRQGSRSGKRAFCKTAS